MKGKNTEGSLASATPSRARASDSDKFDGTPSDLERFLTDVEVKFEMDGHLYPTDRQKILYVSGRLMGKARKWYQSYHRHLSSTARARVPGGSALPQDPVWESYERFLQALSASHDERTTRNNAVREWDQLRHTGSIDKFVDSIMDLMWLTGYNDNIVFDKIRIGFNEEVAKI